MLFDTDQSLDKLNAACLSRRVRRRIERMQMIGLSASLALVAAILYWGPAIHGVLR